MPSHDITVVICAQNAAGTIKRAVESALGQGHFPILLVDDHSTDSTVSVARESGEGRVTIVRPMDKLGLGNARQCGIDNVETKHLMWLDADDELLPGRVERLEHELREGADVVFDEAELYSGKRETKIRNLPFPEFMMQDNAMVRCFERNYLPGPAWPALRTEFAKSIGYDTSLPTGDDLDFNLRAFRREAKFKFVREIGYRQYAYDRSLSRDIPLQKGSAGQALKKHLYREVWNLYLESGYKKRIAAWGLCSMAIFRGEYDAALSFLQSAFPENSNPDDVLEPDGPQPYKESWRWAFFAGTLDLLKGGADAADWLQLAEDTMPSAEGANNHGIALARRGDLGSAQACFEQALERRNDYLDAQLNLAAGETPQRVTTHPLRLEPSRSEYSA